MTRPPQFFPRLSLSGDGHSFPGACDYFPLWLQQRLPSRPSLYVTFLVYRTKPTPTTLAGWDVSEVQGAPRIGRKTLSANEGRSRLGIGQMLETDSQSRASLQADDTGKIQVDPSTRLRLLSMGSGLKRIALDRGTIHAYIWAPPGQFVVDTPSAVTVDLGCAYTLQVDDSGAGMVRTSLGWVGFKLNGHESFIPAGAACATRPKVGPGTPYFEDSSAEFRAALTRFDFEDSTPQQRAHDIAIVLSEARKDDSLTLWHLLARVDDQQRVPRLRPAEPARASSGDRHERRHPSTRSAHARPVVERTRIRRHLRVAPLGALVGWNGRASSRKVTCTQLTALPLFRVRLALVNTPLSLSVS